jgi:hypothetical protein
MRVRSSAWVGIAAALTVAAFLVWRSGVLESTRSGRHGGAVTVRVNPAFVCLDPSAVPYLNFDFVVTNASNQTIVLGAVSASVFDAAGELTERRTVTSGASEILRPDRTVPANTEGLVFNPLLFGSVTEHSRIVYALEFRRGDANDTVAVTVEPQVFRPRTRLVSPIEGRVLVSDGYDPLSHHRRMRYTDAGSRSLGLVDNFQRFALDLVPITSGGETFHGMRGRNESWLAWGRPVRAAGDGIVAALHDGQPDNDTVGVENRWVQRSLTQDEMTTYGNYVLIDHGDGEFSLTAHLRRGSVRVRSGDRVHAGQTIGDIGNSGSSLGPHLHYELRTGWGVRDVRTLPPRFSDAARVGGASNESGALVPNSGDVLMAR